MSLTADDVKFLVYRYLQESGFVHAAYAFRNESDVARMDMDHDDFECGALVKLVQRGLQYMELEANATRDDAASHETRFEVLTAADILRAKTAATLKAVVAERREHSGSTGARAAPEVRACAACGEELDTQAEAVFASRWDASGTRLACYSQGPQCSLWEVGPGGGAAAAPPRRIPLRREGSAVGASAPLVWSPDGRQVAMGMDDGWVCIFDGEGECVQQLSGHTAAGGAAGENAILDLAFSPDSSLLLTACGNGSVTLWSCRSGAALAQYASHAAAAEAVAWRGDGGVFASSSWDGEIHVYRLEGGGERGDVRGTRLRELKGHTVGVDNIVWAPNQWLLASYAEKHIKLWSIHQSACLCDLIDEDCDGRDGDAHSSHNDSVLSIAFRPAGPGSRNPGLALQLATTGEDARAKVWDCENGALLHSLVHRPGTLLSCDWSPDGLTLATGHADGTVTLWDATEGLARREYSAAAGVFHVCWNADGARLAVSTKRGTVVVLDTRR